MNSDAKISNIEVFECPVCGNYKGMAIERTNGKVPVLCKCDLDIEYHGNGCFPDSSLVSPNGKEFWWTPTTHHKGEDGENIYTPHFSAPTLVNKFENPLT